MGCQQATSCNMVEWRYAIAPINHPADQSVVFRIERMYIASDRNANHTGYYDDGHHSESNFHLCGSRCSLGVQ
jgi:hypothetical protein